MACIDDKFKPYPREGMYTKIKFLADEDGSYYVKSEEDLKYKKE